LLHSKRSGALSFASVLALPYVCFGDFENWFMSITRSFPNIS
jgi:hypothetical protein